MTDEHADDEAQKKAARRRRAEQLVKLFPDTTRDESADWGDAPSGSRDDEILRDVPPHHG